MDALWKISLWQQFGAAIDDLENAARAVNALKHAPCGRPCGPVEPVSGQNVGSAPVWVTRAEEQG